MIQKNTNINNSKLIIEEKYKSHIKISNSQVPKLYASPKIH